MITSVKLLAITPQGEGLIERAGHRCYRAEGHKGARFIHGILKRGHTSVLEHWRACFMVKATESEILGLAMQQKLLDISVHETEWIPIGNHTYIVSGNARMFLKAKPALPGFSSDLLDQMKAQLTEAAPVIFAGGLTDFSKHQGCIDQEGDTELWSTFVPGALNEEELVQHGALTLYFENVSRTLTHQLVRHRMASYSQASQRYCGEANFDYFVPDSIVGCPEARDLYVDAVEDDRETYQQLVDMGIPREDARYVLPNSCHSEIVVTMTLENWANFLALRTDKHAQKEIRDAAEQARFLIDRNLNFDLALPPIC